MKPVQHAACAIGLVLFTAACSDGQAGRVADPVPDVPAHQQRTVTRSEFRYDWPFTVGTGTLACSSDAIVFRTAGASYALNDAAKSRGLPPVDPIHRMKGSGPPTNPLGRVIQDKRMQIFAASMACDRNATPAPCKQRLRQVNSLSEAELTQIEAEGQERLWPPLPPQRISLDRLIEAGLKLCQR